MLKVQVALTAILIVSLAFVSCERTQDMLAPVADDMMATDDMMAADDMMMDMMKMIDPSVYMSWAHVSLPAPTMTVAEAAAAGNAAGTGAAHNPGSDIFTSRTVYINDAGAMANKAGTAYPAGTMIIKAIMDETETFVDKVAVMTKSDDPMYAGHNGWIYAKYFLSSDGTPELKAGSHVPEHEGNGCHGCHVKAGEERDSVFVSLSMDDDMMDDTTMDDDMMDDTMMDDNTDDMGDGNGAGDADAGNGTDDANTDAGNGDGAGDTQ